MHPVEWFLLAYLFVAFPALELWRSERLRQRLQADPAGKVSEYRITCLQLWSPTVVLIALWWTGSLSVAELPVVTAPDVPQAIAFALLVLLIVYMAASLKRVASDPDLRKRTAAALKPAGWMLPVDRREAGWFIGPVSLTAGICEELLYRGYLIQWLDLSLPTWAAMVLSSVVFGMVHAYQGLSGMARSAAIGLVLATVFVATGSLLVPILLHVIIDAYSGALSWIALRDDRDPRADSRGLSTAD